MSVKWETPEPVKGTGKRRDWYGIAAELKARPGDWALVAEDVAVGAATQIRNGRYAAFRDGHFETTQRGIDQKRGRATKLYARYLGPKESMSV